MDGPNPWHELLNASKLVLEEDVWRESLLHFIYVLCILIEILVLHVQKEPCWVGSIDIWNDIVYLLAYIHHIPHLLLIDAATHGFLTLGSSFFSASTKNLLSFLKVSENVMLLECIL